MKEDLGRQDEANLQPWVGQVMCRWCGARRAAAPPRFLSPWKQTHVPVSELQSEPAGKAWCGSDCVVQAWRETMSA